MWFYHKATDKWPPRWLLTGLRSYLGSQAIHVATVSGFPQHITATERQYVQFWYSNTVFESTSIMPGYESRNNNKISTTTKRKKTLSVDTHRPDFIAATSRNEKSSQQLCHLGYILMWRHGVQWKANSLLILHFDYNREQNTGWGHRW